MKRNKVASAIAAFGISLGLVVPGALVSASPMPAGFEDTIAFPGDTLHADHNQLGMWVPNSDDAFVVVVPGTTDNRSPRINDLIGDRESLIIRYPESFWPAISGKSGAWLPLWAPTYDESKSVAVAHTVEVMKTLKDSGEVIVYTGYSQGADALGNAAEEAGSLGPNTTVLIISDPRSPWGVKGALKNVPFSGLLLGLLGVQNDGARDPGKTGDTTVIHVIVQGDTIAHAQWTWYRPVTSLVVNLLGYSVIHTGTGPYTYAHIENLKHIKTFKSYEGNSTYEIYDTFHPIALFREMVYGWLGIPVSLARLERWDALAEWFFPTQEITAVNTDATVKLHEVPLTPDPTVPVADPTAVDPALPGVVNPQPAVAPIVLPNSEDGPDLAEPSAPAVPDTVAPSEAPELPTVEGVPAPAIGDDAAETPAIADVGANVPSDSDALLPAA
ncbi:PE-PPE domain-containing protein [Gordonia sp. (in: high G+C Gram-positive bacteria)]|uniref:PE-PPE domain-containing protein n=1 Tax=Gordonia sp. (in: high G+C Gram-positive bacteria) TaxID=84139 RepID=UPI003C72DBF2